MLLVSISAVEKAASTGVSITAGYSGCLHIMRQFYNLERCRRHSGAVRGESVRALHPANAVLEVKGLH